MLTRERLKKQQTKWCISLSFFLYLPLNIWTLCELVSVIILDIDCNIFPLFALA